MRILFTKMHGLGNDFIVIDDLISSKNPTPVTAELARKICDRRLGVGGDQVLWLRPVKDAKAHARMEIFNADGSTAEMCGNGIRAVALYIQKRDPQKSTKANSSYQIETLAGILPVTITGENVRVEMGIPKLGQTQGEDLEISGEMIHFQEVNVGNPHAVIFVDDVEKISLAEIGPKIETHRRFPGRTNVEFVEVVSPSRIRVRVWERGAGITLACGTGACASAAAAIALGKARSPLEVVLPGGILKMEWAGQAHPIQMEGPAVEVFSGEWYS